MEIVGGPTKGWGHHIKGNPWFRWCFEQCLFCRSVGFTPFVVLYGKFEHVGYPEIIHLVCHFGVHQPSFLVRYLKSNALLIVMPIVCYMKSSVDDCWSIIGFTNPTNDQQFSLTNPTTIGFDYVWLNHGRIGIRIKQSISGNSGSTWINNKVYIS